MASSIPKFLELDIQCANPSCKNGPYYFSILWNSEQVVSKHGEYCCLNCKDKCAFGWNYTDKHGQRTPNLIKNPDNSMMVGWKIGN